MSWLWITVGIVVALIVFVVIIRNMNKTQGNSFIKRLTGSGCSETPSGYRI